ncbi:SUMO protease [Phytophthora megakarya]|uniref:SUMO protease n=1 Tax=Phytophthora megakarya TaxID=4795 RepID=A0A225URP5_9STRA|nr:SUMO protease [Phytophthora megakarya]
MAEGTATAKSAVAIFCYDSKDLTDYRKLLEEIAEDVALKGLPQRYKVSVVRSPIQDDKDNNNCRRVNKEAWNDYTKLGLLHRRWDILCAVVTLSDNAGVSSEKEG